MFSIKSVLNDIFSSISIPIIIDYLDYNVDRYCFRCLPTCTDLGSCKTFQDGTHQHAEKIDNIGEGELDVDAILEDGWSSSDNEDVVVEDTREIRDELLGDIPPADTKDDELMEKVRQALQEESSEELPDTAPAGVVEDMSALGNIPADDEVDKVEDDSSMELPSPSPSPAKDSPLEPPPEIRMVFRR